MNLLRISFLLLAVAILSGCNTMQVKKDSVLFFESSYDQVWSAAIQSTNAIGFSIKNSDKESGILFAEGGKNLFTQNYAPQLNVMLVNRDSGVEVSVSAVQPGQMADYGASSSTIAKFNEQMESRLN